MPIYFLLLVYYSVHLTLCYLNCFSKQDAFGYTIYSWLSFSIRYRKFRKNSSLLRDSQNRYWQRTHNCFLKFIHIFQLWSYFNFVYTSFGRCPPSCPFSLCKFIFLHLVYCSIYLTKWYLIIAVNKTLMMLRLTFLFNKVPQISQKYLY